MSSKLIYNSWFGYYFGQMKWFRRWYGGNWCKVIPRPFPYMWLWMRECEVTPIIEVITDVEVYK